MITKGVNTLNEEEIHLIPDSNKDIDVQEFTSIMNGLNLSYPKHIDEALPANMECGLQNHQAISHELYCWCSSNTRFFALSLIDDPEQNIKSLIVVRNQRLSHVIQYGCLC